MMQRRRELIIGEDEHWEDEKNSLNVEKTRTEKTGRGEEVVSNEF